MRMVQVEGGVRLGHLKAAMGATREHALQSAQWVDMKIFLHDVVVKGLDEEKMKEPRVRKMKEPASQIGKSPPNKQGVGEGAEEPKKVEADQRMSIRFLIGE